jgi:hypothetical protein
MKKGLAAVAAVLAILIAGCAANDPTASDEYGALETELAQTNRELAEAEDELAEMTAHCDELAADAVAEAPTTRYQNAKANQETLLAVIADPSAFGSEEEVLDLLDDMATPDVRSGDLAFGGVSTGIWRQGWRNTLFNGSDATIRTWTAWLSEDGSVGGSLWTWSGTAQSGEPFDLQGIEVSRFDEDGRYTEVIMQYPYDDAEVHRRYAEGT